MKEKNIEVNHILAFPYPETPITRKLILVSSHSFKETKVIIGIFLVLLEAERVS
jgi:hypothetical protein